MEVLGADGGSSGKPVLVEELRDLGHKGDALAHAFNLHFVMLFEDEFAQEHALVEAGVPSHPEHISLVELAALFVHLQLSLKYDIYIQTHIQIIIHLFSTQLFHMQYF